MRFRSIWIILLFCAAASHGQDPAALTAPPGSGKIATWLRSGDSRLIAWGATFTGQTHDNARIPDLIALAAAWQPQPPSTSETDNARREDREQAMESVLDALIQTQAAVPAGAIEKFAYDFPEQAVILLSRLPWQEAQPTLLRLYFDPVRYAWGLQRGAAAMLALHPPPGFAASLLSQIALDAYIKVTPIRTQDDRVLTGSSSCGLLSEPRQLSDWPKINTYGLDDKFPTEEGEVVVIPGSPGISTYRGVGASGSCYFRLGDEERVRLIAQMLGKPIEPTRMVPDHHDNCRCTTLVPAPATDPLLLMLHTSQTIEYRDGSQFLHETQTYLTGLQAKLHAVATALEQGQLMTSQEVDGAPVTIRLEIDDRRGLEADPLPAISADDPAIRLSTKIWH
jgi:hypothetical protein